MGRGGYDNTDASQSKSSSAQYAINAHHDAQVTAQREAEVQQEIEDEAKGIRSKKSRGIMDARRAAMLQANATISPTKTSSQSEKDDAVTK